MCFKQAILLEVNKAARSGGEETYLHGDLTTPWATSVVIPQMCRKYLYSGLTTNYSYFYCYLQLTMAALRRHCGLLIAPPSNDGGKEGIDGVSPTFPQRSI